MSEAGGRQGTRLVLVDDQDLIRLGIKSLLGALPEVEIVGEARTGNEAVDLCRRLEPDLVVMDIGMPGMDGLTATRSIKEENSKITVLVLTSYDDPEYLLQAIRAGADGFVLKEHAFDRITSAVRRVLNGESPLDQELAMRLLGVVSRSSEQPQEVPSLFVQGEGSGRGDTLTQREREVLRLLALGYNNQQIAQELSLSVATVKTHVHRIISKLGVSDRTQAAILAIRTGLTPTWE